MRAAVTADRMSTLHPITADHVPPPSMHTGTCPYGPPIVAKGNVTNIHGQSMECSNAGFCNRNTGRCTCLSGYTGDACQRRTT